MSILVHGLFLGLAFSISPFSDFSPAPALPVRITYFKAPVLSLPPAGGGLVAAPVVASVPDSLPPRPITASSSPSSRSEGQAGDAGAIGDGPGPLGGEALPLGVGEPEDDASGQGPQEGEVLGGEASQVGTPQAVASLPSGEPQSIVPVAPPDTQATPKPSVAPSSPKGPDLEGAQSGGASGTSSIKVESPSKDPGQGNGSAIPVAPAQAQTEAAPKSDPPEAVASVVSGTGTGGILVIKKGMAQPKLTKKVVPRYPPMAKAQRVKGIVIVTVTVDERGRVVDADIATSPSPLLNAEALAAANKMRFAPYKVEGRPVKFMTRVPFRFDFR